MRKLRWHWVALVGLALVAAVPVWLSVQELAIDIDAVSGATKKKADSKAPPAPPAPEEVQRQEVIFLGWQVIGGRAPAIVADLGQVKGRKVIHVSVENTDRRNRREATPPAAISDLAETLLLGQTVEVELKRAPGGAVLVSMKAVGETVAAAEPQAFEFIRSRSQRVGDRMHLVVSAKLREHAIEFIVPNEPQSEEDRKRNNKPNPPEEIRKAVEGFRAGDFVAIGYRTRQYRCEVESIQLAELKAKGTYFSHVPRSGGDVAAVVQIRQGQENLILFVPTDKAEEIAAVVAKFKRDDPVEATYQKVNRRTWLVSIKSVPAEGEAAGWGDEAKD